MLHEAQLDRDGRHLEGCWSTSHRPQDQPPHSKLEVSVSGGLKRGWRGPVVGTLPLSLGR